MAERPIPPDPDKFPNNEAFRKALAEWIQADDAWKAGQKKNWGFGSKGSAIETTKFLLDVAGVADPTGIADLTSAGISLTQGVTKAIKGEEGAGQHFIDAGISAVSALPGGDIAKLGKLRKFWKGSKSAGKSASRLPDAAAGVTKGGAGGAGVKQSAGSFFDKFAGLFSKVSSKEPESVKENLRGSWEAIQGAFGHDASSVKLANAEAAMQDSAHKASEAYRQATVAQTSRKPELFKQAKEAKRAASKAFKAYQAAKQGHEASVAKRPESVRHASEGLADSAAVGPAPGEGLFGFGKRVAKQFFRDERSHRERKAAGEFLVGKDAPEDMIHKAGELAQPYLDSAREGLFGRGGGRGSGGGGNSGGGSSGTGPGGFPSGAGKFAKGAADLVAGMGGKLIGGALGGPVGAAIGEGVAKTFVDIAEAGIKLTKAIVDWSEALLGSQRKLAAVSGPQAAIFAQRDVRQIQRDIISGRNTAGSTARLASSMDALMDELRPIKDILKMLAMEVLSELVRELRAATILLKVVAKIQPGPTFDPGGALSEMRKLGTPPSDDDSTSYYGFQNFLNDMSTKESDKDKVGTRVPKK